MASPIPTFEIPPPLNRKTVLLALANLHEEWREAANGKPLEEIPTSVGLLFDDVMCALGLTELEQGQVKGWWQQGYSRNGKTP